MQTGTRLRSTVMRLLASEGWLRQQQRRARLRRRIRRAAPCVQYFHQTDDPYSHLAVQKLEALRNAYAINFQIHLVSGPQAAFQGSSDLFADWALRDAQSIARDYGTTLPGTAYPDAPRVSAANDLLAAHLQAPDFPRAAIDIGNTLWSGTSLPGGLTKDGNAAVREGNTLRARLGHFLGGMFHFDGEWFWGIDRIRVLELRLQAEGFGAPSGSLCVPEPTPVDTTGMQASDVVLEYFPSLRSPYTAIGQQRVLDLVARSGVTLELRPVMPMMMRGVPAPRAKQQYIIMDAAREARYRQVPFGHIVDPFGEPVKKAFALYSGAVNLGRGLEFVTAYLRAAWTDGVDITTDKGLQTVASNAGLDWTALASASRNADWETALDANLQAMLAARLWGVPSFRVSGGRAVGAFACWGQDRIWRVENEIARRA
ncbi:MAG: DsbA family protein [Pseudomonadales bacterium]|nr:DsbA family protein [Pseudomonadales bacterium]